MKSVGAKFLLFIGIFMVLLILLLLNRTYQTTKKNIYSYAQDDVSTGLAFNLAIRKYVGENIRPVMYELLGEEEFMPETMSTSYVARSIFEEVQKEFPDRLLKFSSDNPRNPVNQAGPEELKMIAYFNNHPDKDRWTGEITINNTPYMAKFSARRMEPSCLRCHGDPADAPKALLEKYGATAGFYRPMGEVIGLDTIGVPMRTVNQQLRSEFIRNSVMTGLGLAVLFLAAILVFRVLVSRRLQMMTDYFQELSREPGYARIKTFEAKGRDEISRLAKSFNVLAGKLKETYASLEDQVRERTRDLMRTNESLKHEVEERRAVEAELSRFKSTLDHTLDSVFMFDSKTLKFIYVNQGAIDQLGYGMEEYFGMTPVDINPDFTEESFWKTASRLIDGKQSAHTYETVHRHKSGRLIPVEIFLQYVVLSGDSGRFVAIVRDITERKQAEAVIRLDESRSKALLELNQMVDAPIGEIANFALEEAVRLTSSRVGYVAFVNAAQTTLSMYAWSKSAMDQCRISDKPMVTAVDSTGLWGEAFRQRKPVVTNDYAAPGPYKKGVPEGHVNIIRHMNLPIIEDDKVVLVAGVANKETDYDSSDIRQLTLLMSGMWRMVQRKQTAEEKERLEAQLQRAEKMETIGTLAGGVAHDLNNILGAIVGYPDLLLEDISEDSPFRGPIQTIKESGERAASIVQDLLTLARRGIAVIEVVNINNVINRYLETREYFKVKEFHPNVKVKTDLLPDLLNIAGSPVHLSKVIMNLVSNAAEAMPGGGEIVIATKNSYLDQPIKGYDKIAEGEYVVVSVSDNGIGISDADLKRIFEPFYTKKVMGRSGTGLGMAVVWGTVKDHNGYIDVDSEEGGGTVFTLYFPATRKSAELKAAPVSVDAYVGNGERILIVDDVALQREIASSLLKKLNYYPVAVDSGEAAVAYMKNNSADLLILDMIMDPGIDGLETYKRILKIHPGQKVVIASGFSETRNVQEAQQLGAGAYIKKPYTIEAIGLAVKTELDKRSNKQT